MDYYYIVLDKFNKTLELITSDTCYATTVEKWLEAKGLTQYLSRDLSNQFSFFWNGQNSEVDRSKIYKYARKYTDITDYAAII